MKSMRNGFTLVEMLVVLGIIGILIAATAGGYSAFVKKAQDIRGIELVHQTTTALGSIFQQEEYWPPVLLNEGQHGDGKLDKNVAWVFAQYKTMSVNYEEVKDVDGATYRLMGNDKFGIVSPWATDALKHSGKNISINTHVNTGGTVQDHILHFAVDGDRDGITEVLFGYGGVKASVRAPCCVWCCGRDGKFGTKDDLRSWTKSQEVR